MDHVGLDAIVYNAAAAAAAAMAIRAYQKRMLTF
jgi:hypothetical protein